jgi:hypothetical protein
MEGKISIKKLMTIERILLEINTKYKFQLEFYEAYKIYEYLKEIGSITNYVFLLQDEFRNSNEDLDKLKEYHNKIMNSDTFFDYKKINKITAFIDNVVKEINNDALTMTIEKLKFW